MNFSKIYDRYLKRLLLLIPVFFLCGFYSCQNKTDQPEFTAFNGEIFGTTYSIKVIVGDTFDINQFQHDVDSLLALINLTFSTYSDSTLITFFNNGKSDSGLLNLFKTDERFRYGHRLFVSCLQISKTAFIETNGAFDPTAGALFKLWGFAEGEVNRAPDSMEVRNALNMKGLDCVNVITTDDDMEIAVRNSLDSLVKLNFNAVAKGMAVDEVAKLTESWGITSYMVEIGGELRVSGRKSADEPWVIGINRPERSASVTDALLYLAPENTGVATSGNYRNYYESNGKLYAHIIDPVIGYPAETDLLSVTVFHPECGIADAYATAFMVVGAKQAIEMAEMNGLDYVFIQRKDAGFEVITSENVKPWIIE